MRSAACNESPATSAQSFFDGAGGNGDAGSSKDDSDASIIVCPDGHPGGAEPPNDRAAEPPDSSSYAHVHDGRASDPAAEDWLMAEKVTLLARRSMRSWPVSSSVAPGSAR
jgi:hypothetical protein